MYDELIKNLREDSASALQNCEFDFVHAWMLKAADAIEDLSKQRDLALARLCEWCGICSKEHRDAWGCDDIARLQELQLPRWISVTERLPEEDTSCLVFLIGGEFGQLSWMSMAIFYNGVFRYDDHSGEFDQITHWMPLPEPPKEETDAL